MYRKIRTFFDLHPQANDSTGNDSATGRKCKCNEDGNLLTTTKEGPNKGRKFWTCAKGKDNGSCGFFEWDDEPPRNPASGTASRSSSMNTANAQATGSATDVCFKVRMKSSHLPSMLTFDQQCQQTGHWANCKFPSSERQLALT